MTNEDFCKGLVGAINADPLRDFARQCVKWGMDESEVVRLAKSPGLTVEEPYLVRFVNLVRDIRRGHEAKEPRASFHKRRKGKS